MATLPTDLPETIDRERVSDVVELSVGLDNPFGQTLLLLVDGRWRAVTRDSVFDPFAEVALGARPIGFQQGAIDGELTLPLADGGQRVLEVTGLDRDELAQRFGESAAAAANSAPASAPVPAPAPVSAPDSASESVSASDSLSDSPSDSLSLAASASASASVLDSDADADADAVSGSLSAPEPPQPPPAAPTLASSSARVRQREPEAELRELLEQGEFVEAVKLYREQHATDLQTSLEAVEQLKQQLLAELGFYPQLKQLVQQNLRKNRRLSALKQLQIAEQIDLHEATRRLQILERLEPTKAKGCVGCVVLLVVLLLAGGGLLAVIFA